MKPLSPLSSAAVADALHARGVDVPLRVYDTVDSTNTRARRLIDAAPLLIVSRAQTAGRGRLGRTFFSPPDSGLYMTLLYPLTRPLAQAVTVTAEAAVATLRAIREETGLAPDVKWVNDLYLGGKKICGILTEAVTPAESTHPACLLIGIGINLTTDAYPPDLRAPAGSLSEFLPADAPSRVLDPSRLCAAVTAHLLACLRKEGVSADEIYATYKAHSLLLGRPVICTRGDASFSALALDITPDYGLLVRREDGTTEVLHSGEAGAKL